MIGRGLLVAIGLALAAASAAAAERVALVVGVSRYQHIPALDNPQRDAQLMADTLRRLGFTLVGGGPQLDLDKPGFDKAVRSFGQQIPGAAIALFYYAGHGLQVRGTNWLVPTDANVAREADADFMLVDAGLVLRQMEAAGTKLNLMILDACRNNPFGGRGLRAASGGLAQMQAPEGTLISYATQPGNVALDGQDGNSPFTKALAQTLTRPGLDVFRTFNEVGLAVKRATGGAQQPWVSNSPIDGDLYFGGAPAGAQTASAAPAAAPAAPPAPDAELLFWQTIAGSSDPVDFQEYLRQYPNGRFAGLARSRAQPAPAPAAPAPAALQPAAPAPASQAAPKPAPSPQLAAAPIAPAAKDAGGARGAGPRVGGRTVWRITEGPGAGGQQVQTITAVAADRMTLTVEAGRRQGSQVRPLLPFGAALSAEMAGPEGRTVTLAIEPLADLRALLPLEPGKRLDFQSRVNGTVAASGCAVEPRTTIAVPAGRFEVLPVACHYDVARRQFQVRHFVAASGRPVRVETRNDGPRGVTATVLELVSQTE